MTSPKPIYTQRHNVTTARLTFALPHEGKELLDSLGQHNRKSITLAKQDDLSVVLMAIRSGDRLAEHSANGTVTIQVVQGRASIHLDGETIPAAEGTLVQLAGGVRHDVAAETDSVILITVAAGEAPATS